jgi:hypothetical protein
MKYGLQNSKSGLIYSCDKYGNLGRKNMRQRLFWHLIKFVFSVKI